MKSRTGSGIARVVAGQRGFTLIEILVVMAVGSMMMMGLVIATFQAFGSTKANRTEITALDNVRSAAYWITQDIKKAGATNLTDGGPAANSLNLTWTLWYDVNGNLIPGGENHSVAYALSGTELRRNLDGSVRPVAKYVTSISFSQQASGTGHMVTITITASPEGKPETAQSRTYDVYLQPKTGPVN
jgi:prepilin-type N-terminal cleavage/methylation domain-containing protein